MTHTAANSRLRVIRSAMSSAEWARLTAMLGFIAGVNAAGWGIFVLYVLPHHFDYKGEGGSAGLGVGITLAAGAVFGAMVDPNSAYETAGSCTGSSAGS